MLVDFHEDQNADATVCVIRVPLDEASRYGIMAVDDRNHIVDFVEKPANPPGDLANMGVYVFKLDVLEEPAARGCRPHRSAARLRLQHHPRMMEMGMKDGISIRRVLIDVGTIDAYWEAHMDLLASPPSLDLNDRSWIIHTRSERPPVRIDRGAIVEDSMITDGSIICAGARGAQRVVARRNVGPNALVYESVI